MTISPEEVLRQLIDGVTGRRWADLPALYADDAVVDHPLGLPSPTRLTGRAAVAAHFDAASGLPLEMEAENLVVHRGADPEVVVGEFDYAGRNTRTGVPFRLANVFVLRVRDGRIVRSRDYSDHARFAAALGRLDAVAAALQPAPSESARALVERSFAAFNARELDVLDELYAPGCVSHPLGTVGVQAIRESRAALADRFPEARVAVLDLLVDGDRVAARSRLTGGPEAALLELFRVEDGRIAELWGMGG